MKSFILLFLIITFKLYSQHYKSIHQIENDYYKLNYNDENRKIFKTQPNNFDDKPLSLSNVIYGFHPYWQNGSESNYYFSLLTHIAYFSAEVNTDGSFSTTRSWATANVVTLAQKYGKKVHLCVTMFSNHSTLLTNSTSVNNLINNILTQINVRNADGANIDFEGVSSSVKTDFRNFIYQLGTTLKANNKELVVELPAVDWSNVYDATFFSTVNSVVDYYFLMAYDYWWSGSTTAGPVAPITTGTAIRHVERSIDAYLGINCPASKLIAGFPYYGYEWPVVSDVRMANTTGTGSSKIYSTLKTFLAGIPSGDKFFDNTYKSPWYRYQNSGQWYQGWYEDENSLEIKYNLVKTKGIAGTGMWALGYDGTNTELWNKLKSAFASVPPVTNTIFDDFETGVGRFNQQPTYSGTTTGISTASSSAWNKGFANNGAGSLEVILKDNTSSTNNWTVRLLSGGGDVANNIVFSNYGYLGVYLKTSTAPSGAQIAICVDDGNPSVRTLISSKQNVINDGEWHLYQWNLATTTWTVLAGSGTTLQGPNCYLDALMFYAPNNSPDWTFYIDDVSYNSNTPLPVELIEFTVSQMNNNINLNWKTATEKNNYGWEIENSIKYYDGKWTDWEKIGFQSGNVNSNSLKNYSFTLINVKPGENKFRLKQIDVDGNKAYSEEKIIFVKSFDDIFLSDNYPNPFNPVTNINFSLGKPGFVKLIIYDALGKEILKPIDEFREQGNYNYLFDGTGLASGLYFYSLQFNNQKIVKKMLLIK